MQPQTETESSHKPFEATATIPIEVIRNDDGALLAGTFTQPPPLVRVKLGSLVQWELKKVDERDTFVVSFPDGSPLSGHSIITAHGRHKIVSALGERTGPLRASVEGIFHYQVFVTDGATGAVYSIHNCPEFEVR